MLPDNANLLLVAGIPKFYRWLSERYPLLNQKLTLTEGPPDIDNLYLDMNGIIHNCTHANRKDIGNVTEEGMMLKVFDYLEKLIQIVRPQKLLFMAIDGRWSSGLGVSRGVSGRGFSADGVIWCSICSPQVWDNNGHDR